MASTTKTARLLVLLQIALFLFSAVLMSSSVCHGARDGGHGVMTTGMIPSYGVLDPNRPACIGSPCRGSGEPYTRQSPYGGETPPARH
ncbi:hypothetical protein U9M48_027163 [Paspalum notatum var. saurae]|uniref:Uncharacterized protein n=1 Tax=Paspalum notatum var. saurae TaxID=547442 RepID=A0AAQ3TVZ1_PASNO